MRAVEPASNKARVETRIVFRIIQDQPLNSDWMPRLTLESTHILAVIPQLGENESQIFACGEISQFSLACWT